MIHSLILSNNPPLLILTVVLVVLALTFTSGGRFRH